jgi:hypothetical protein
MSRWTKWVAGQTDWTVVHAWLARWPMARGGLHGRLSARWQRMGRDARTGLWWAKRSQPPQERR